MAAARIIFIVVVLRNREPDRWPGLCSRPRRTDAGHGPTVWRRCGKDKARGGVGRSSAPPAFLPRRCFRRGARPTRCATRWCRSSRVRTARRSTLLEPRTSPKNRRRSCATSSRLMQSRRACRRRRRLVGRRGRARPRPPACLGRPTKTARRSCGRRRRTHRARGLSSSRTRRRARARGLWSSTTCRLPMTTIPPRCFVERSLGGSR